MKIKLWLMFLISEDSEEEVFKENGNFENVSDPSSVEVVVNLSIYD